MEIALPVLLRDWGQSLFPGRPPTAVLRRGVKFAPADILSVVEVAMSHSAWAGPWGSCPSLSLSVPHRGGVRSLVALMEGGGVGQGAAGL